MKSGLQKSVPNLHGFWCDFVSMLPQLWQLNETPKWKEHLSRFRHRHWVHETFGGVRGLILKALGGLWKLLDSNGLFGVLRCARPGGMRRARLLSAAPPTMAC